MQRVLVDSTTLASAGHEARSAIVELQCRSGAVYRMHHMNTTGFPGR